MKILLIALSLSMMLLGSACGSGNENQPQNQAPNVNSNSSKNENNPAQKEKTTLVKEEIGNIKEKIKFNDEKPAILSIIDSEKMNLKAVGLKKGQIMSKHKAGLKSFVVVLEGKIDFDIDGKKFELGEMDTYEIPVNVEHEIRALEQSIFSLTQEK